MKFSDKADHYESHAFIQADLAAWTAQWLDRLDPLPGPALEIGAGTGLFTRHLVSWHPDIIATDASAAMVALGKENVPSATWDLQDAWTSRPGPWGGIFSSSLLQWCPAPRQVFTNWCSQLAPGASMLHGFFLEGTLEELRRISPECLAVQFLHSGKWEASFKGAGFDLLDVEVCQVQYGFPSGIDLFRFLHGIGATLGPRRLTPSALRRVIEECDRQRSQSASGEVESQWVFGRFLCRRPV